jgi:hypothetical protein
LKGRLVFVGLLISFRLFLFDYDITSLGYSFFENTREKLLGKFIRGLAKVLLNGRWSSAVPILVIWIDWSLSEAQNLRIKLIHKLLKVHGRVFESEFGFWLTWILFVFLFLILVDVFLVLGNSLRFDGHHFLQQVFHLLLKSILIVGKLLNLDNV